MYLYYTIALPISMHNSGAYNIHLIIYMYYDTESISVWSRGKII